MLATNEGADHALSAASTRLNAESADAFPGADASAVTTRPATE